jgi:hypothetical protein
MPNLARTAEQGPVMVPSKTSHPLQPRFTFSDAGFPEQVLAYFQVSRLSKLPR